MYIAVFLFVVFSLDVFTVVFCSVAFSLFTFSPTFVCSAAHKILSCAAILAVIVFVSTGRSASLQHFAAQVDS